MTVDGEGAGPSAATEVPVLNIRSKRCLGPTSGPSAAPSLRIPVTRNTVALWVEESTRSTYWGNRRLPLPDNSVVWFGEPLDEPILAESISSSRSYVPWIAQLYVTGPDTIRFRIFTSDGEKIATGGIDQWILRWLELYWAPEEEHGQRLGALVEVDEQRALDVLQHGLRMKGQAECRRLKGLQPSQLMFALEHPDRSVREQALGVLRSLAPPG